MHSELLRLGPITIHAYGLCLALGFMASVWVATRLSARDNRHTADALSTLAIWLILAGIVGARIAYVAEHWTTEFADPLGQGSVLALFRIDQGGLMFYGGLAGSTVALAIFARVTRDTFLGLSDLVVSVLPLGHAFGRIGCFLHGCCYGRVTDGVCGVRFPRYSPAWYDHISNGLLQETAAHSLPVIPTQLIETAGNLILFALLASHYRRWSKRPGHLLGAYCIGYAILRFVVEALRGDPRMPVGPFSISQAASLGLAVFGAAVLLYTRRKPSLTPFVAP